MPTPKKKPVVGVPVKKKGARDYLYDEDGNRKAKGAIGPYHYFKAWKWYFYNPSAHFVAAKMGISINAARRLITEGDKRLGLEPLRDRLTRVLKDRVEREDRDIIAAVSIGKTALRRQLEILQARQDSLEERPDEIPASVVASSIVQLLGASIKMHPDVSYRIHGRKMTEEEMKRDPSLLASEALNEVFSGIIGEIVRKRLPGVEIDPPAPEGDPDPNRL